MVTIPHSVFPQNIIYHNYQLLFPVEDNQRIQILEYKLWRFACWNSCLRSSWFSLSRREFFYFGICWCWFCCLRHQKSHAFCVIFTLLLVHTDRLWHRCGNISGLEWFCCFHYCHQKRKDFFSSAGCTLDKIQKKKDLELWKTLSDNFSTVPFFPESVGKLFACYV